MRRRREFPTYVQRQALARSKRNGDIPCCESARVPSLADIGCERELRSGDFNYDHIQAGANNGANIIDNCAVLCKTCHAIKTREHDVPAIAQDKRVSDFHHGIAYPWRVRLPGGRGDAIRKKITGQVVPR